VLARRAGKLRSGGWTSQLATLGLVTLGLAARAGLLCVRADRFVEAVANPPIDQGHDPQPTRTDRFRPTVADGGKR
jgi:hypothetical protein